jgi:hypothetical protein
MVFRDSGLPPREPGKPHVVPPVKPRRWKSVTAWVAGILLAFLVTFAVAAGLAVQRLLS